MLFQSVGASQVACPKNSSWDAPMSVPPLPAFCSMAGGETLQQLTADQGKKFQHEFVEDNPQVIFLGLRIQKTPAYHDFIKL